MHNSILARHTHPARDRKTVKRCEGATCIVCSTGSTNAPFIFGKHMCSKNRKQLPFGAINWLYKWLESLKLSLVLQLAKFRN